MKWAVLLGSAAISGGSYVIFEHSIRAWEKGEDITIITTDSVSMDELYWHPQARKLKWKTYDEVADECFDVVIATWWRSVYEAYRVHGKRYIYFVQSIESKFYNPSEKPTCQLVEATYMLPFEIITEATWIKEYLAEHYNKSAILVHNGIRKDIYKEDGECHAERCKGNLRVLVEGPVDVGFKNIPKTIELCKQSKADEIWLMTSSDINFYPGVTRVFSRVPIFETPKVYRSCDVIVKLSYVEGMFGPPLEMYHCGGTSITYDVTGHDEYIIHDQNGLVVKTDDDEKVVEYLNRLKEDEGYLDHLKQGARMTAEAWDSWDAAAEKFGNAVYTLFEKENNITQKHIEDESKFHFKSYVIAEDYLNELKFLKNNSFKRRLWVRFKRLFPNQLKRNVKLLLHIQGDNL